MTMSSMCVIANSHRLKRQNSNDGLNRVGHCELVSTMLVSTSLVQPVHYFWANSTQQYFIYYDLFLFQFYPARQGWEKLVYRLIIMFLSTEIFSKRRKIYSWIEEKPEYFNNVGAQQTY